MKKYVLSLLMGWSLFFSFHTQAFSQGYVPFPENSACWVVHDYFANTTVPGQNLYYYYRWYRYYITGDTVFNSTHYIVLNGDIKEYVDTLIGGPVIGTTGGLPTIFYRNDSLSKKVYKYYPDSSLQEHLWYDFNLNVGDTIKLWSSSAGDMIVTAIDTINYCGIPRKRFEYACNCWPDGIHNYLIEGVGNLSNFEMNRSDLYEHGATHLEDYTDYIHCTGGEFTNLTMGLGEYTNVSSWLAFPNPVSNSLFFSSPARNIRIYDMLGKIRMQRFGETNSMDVSTLSTGNYIIQAEVNGTMVRKQFIKN